MFRRSWFAATFSAVLIAGIYGIKGWYIAGILGGRYPVESALVDMLGVAVIVIFLRVVYFAIEKVTNALFCPERSPLRSALSQGTRIASLLMFAIPFLLTIAQFCPQRLACAGSPADYFLKYESVDLTSSAGRLKGWYVPSRNEDRPIVLVTHGLGANKENFLAAVLLVNSLDYGALIVDFRAHGDSDGEVTTFGYLEAEDIQAAVDWIQSSYPGRPIYALAYSMGGAAVLRAAARTDPFEKLIIDSSFAAAETVARGSVIRHFGWFQTPAWAVGRCWGWLISGVDLADHQPIQSIGKLQDRPILLIHGTDDRLIPPAESERLARAAGGNATLWLVEKAGHTGSIEHPEYAPRVRRFLDAQLTER